MFRIWQLGLSVGMLGLLAACSSIIGAFSAEDNLDAARTAGAPADAFSAALQQEYITLGQTEFDENDYRDADRYALKALAAGNGESVQPFDPGSWDISQDEASELYGARQQLLLDLDNNGRTTATADAARAQAMYDCWVEEQDEGHEADDIAACRDGFSAALAAVQDAIAEPEEEPEPVAAPEPAPEPAARDYLVYFDFDKTDIRDDAASILNRVIEAMSELGSNSITLTGHADRSGADDYNQSLSVNRALAVSDYLKANGITSGISTSGKGESDPRVPTADGVKEQENRRVEIRIN